MTKAVSFQRKNGTLLALACAAAFAMPQIASAAAEFGDELEIKGHPLTLQGAISIGYARIDAKGATNGGAGDYAARNAIWTGESNIRFSASSKLGGSFIQGIGFQVESGFSTDDGTSGATGGVLATRNTGLGLKTSIGSIWGGKWDTPYKSLIADHGLFSSSLGLQSSQTGFGGSMGFGGGTGGTANGNTTSVSNTMNFRRRQVNTINYFSPEMNGFSVSLQYGANEELGAGNSPSPTTNPSLLSARAQYEIGKFSISIAHERHNDYLWGAALNTANAGRFGATSTARPGSGTQSEDKAWAIGAAYAFGDTTIMGFWEKLDYSQSGGTTAVSGIDNKKWYLNVAQKLGGPHQIRVGYGRASSYGCSITGDANGLAFTAAGGTCSDTGVQNFNFVYRYQLDKRSYINAYYGRFDNDRNGNWVPSGGLSTINGTTAGSTAGNTHTSYSIGLNTTF